MKRNVIIILVFILILTGLSVFARTTTTGLGLIKPTWEEEDPEYDILVDLNANWDILEALSNDPLEFDTGERLEDRAGAMWTGNTETFIALTYQDSDNTIDAVVPVKDEDNMASNSAVFLVTQQSVKAYADTLHALQYLKTEIDALSEVETIWSKDVIDSDELASALGSYYLKTAIDSQGEVETIWGVTLSTDAERDALTYSDVGAIQDAINTIDSNKYVDGSIDHEHLAADVISGMTDVTSTDSDYILIWDATDSALKKVDMGEVRGAGALTYLELTDTPAAYDTGKYAKSTAAGVIWDTPAGAGETNTASNIGSEAEIFKQKTDEDLEFRTLKEGTAINFTYEYGVTLKISNTSYNNSGTVYDIHYAGQWWLAGSTYVLGEIQALLYRVGDGDTMTLYVFNADGDNKPTGGELGHVEVDCASITTSTAGEYVTFDLSSFDITITNGNKYSFYLVGDSNNSDHSIKSNFNIPSVIDNSARITSDDSGGSWTVAATNDTAFKIYTAASYYDYIQIGVVPSEIKLDDLGTPDNNTDLDASTSEHGLMPLLPNVATQFIDGTGVWATLDDGDIPNDITIDLATAATTVTLTDNENTNEENEILFAAGAAGSGAIGVEGDGDLTYNPSTGTLSATKFKVYRTGESTALNAGWWEIKTTATTGDHTGLRTVMISDAASGDLNVRGVYGQGVVEAGKYTGILAGGLFTASNVGGSGDIDNVYVLGAHYSSGESTTVSGDFYLGYLKSQTRETNARSVSGYDVLLGLENEAIQGTGMTMDSAIRIFGTNLGVDGFTYGIDMSSADIATADIILQNGETIKNTTDGEVEISGKIKGDGSLLTNIGVETATGLSVDAKEKGTSAIVKGQAVYTSGSAGVAKPLIGLAQNDTEGTAHMIGLAAEDFSQGGNGLVRVGGLLEGIATLGETDVNPAGETWLAGQELYLSPTEGGLTNVRPTSGHIVEIGWSLYGSSNTDAILVQVDTPSHGVHVAATDNIILRMGADNGSTSIKIRNFSNTDVANIDDQGDADFNSLILDTVLAIAEGGTNSGTGLNGSRVMVSSATAVVESANITTTELELLNGLGNTIVTDNNAVTDLEGLGLTVDTGTLKVDYADISDEIAGDIAEGELADSIIVSADIKDGVITEADLKVVDSPNDEEIFTFEATTGDFEWHTKAELGIGTATSITDNLIIEIDLNADEEPTDNDILTFDTTGDNFSWQTPAELSLGDMNDLVDDTDPDLGGELDAGAHSIGFTLQTDTGTGAKTIDWRLGNKMQFTFGAGDVNFTFTAPTNPCTLMLTLIQDGGGSRTITWPGTVKWAGGTEPTLTTAGGSRDKVALDWDGSQYDAVASLDFK